MDRQTLMIVAGVVIVVLVIAWIFIRKGKK